jgi:mannan endo-1,4-beta-mannosidase
MVALVGAVFGLDLLWSLLVGSTGSAAYGLVDVPAHLATCAIALLAVATVAGLRLPSRFVAAALFASVAIDIDHIPGYMGWSGLTGSLPRPYTHSLVLVLALAAVAWLSRGRATRQICSGLAFGVSIHLFRDLATGPGIPLGWPAETGIAHVPYLFYALVLGLTPLAALAPERGGIKATLGLTALLAGLALGVIAIAAPPAGAHARRVSIGAYIPGADNNPSLIDNFDSEVGRPASTIIVYKDWTQAPFVFDQLDGIWNHGADPVITWEPWDVSLTQIADGGDDQYIYEAARAAAVWGKPLFVRFGQEMNGSWFPWAGHPVAYKRAWRHLVRVFREVGADNVRWVWNPYAEGGPGQSPFAPYFPGGRWVDWAGLDNTNWGGPPSWWVPFGPIAGSSYRQILALTSRPVMLGEVGSGEQGGSKARWLSAMLRRNVPRMQHIRAMLFWSVDDARGDLRVNSSYGALSVVRGALASPLYSGSRQTLLSTRPPLYP